MIYLIQIGVQLSEPGAAHPEYKSVLKIGYTSDTNYKKRLSIYDSHCAFCDYVIALVKGGTTEDEAALHSYFKSFLFKGREWFDSVDEILDFFKANKTIEEIREALPEKKPVFATKLSAAEKIVLNQKYSLIFRLMKEEGINYPLPELKKFIKEKLVNSTESLFAHLSFKFPDSCDKLKERYNEVYTEIAKALEAYNSNPHFEERMKMVCELSSTMDSTFFSYFLQIIPSAFGSYLHELGPSRCAAFGYRNDYLMAELTKKINNSGKEDVVKAAILSHFKIGEQYTRTFIKEELRKIYADLGYKKTPKATDLRLYYQIRLASVRVGPGMGRENGFIIDGLKVEN